MTNNPLEILKREHVNILKVVKAMENIAVAVESGADLEIDLLEQCADFMKMYADLGHHGKEEDVLFNYLYEHNLRAASAPIPVLKYEHEEARRLVKALKGELESLKQNQAHSRENLLQVLRDIAQLYSAHIWKEDFRFFPMSDAVLAEEDKAEVMSLFEGVNKKFGEEVLQRYENFAEEIERKVSH